MKSAFTLIEIMIVVAILALAMSISFPSGRRIYLNIQIKKTEKDIVSFLEVQRLEAARLSRICVISLDRLEPSLESKCADKNSVLKLNPEFNFEMSGETFSIYPDGRALGNSATERLSLRISQNKQEKIITNLGTYGVFVSE